MTLTVHTFLRLCFFGVCGHSSMTMAQSTGSFTATGSMTMLRDGHTATLLTTGQVLIAGGFSVPPPFFTATLLHGGKVFIAGRDSIHAAGSAELYDEVTGTFSSNGSMLTQSEEGHTATLLPTGSVLLSGGWVCCGFSIVTAQTYLPPGLAPGPMLFSLSGDRGGQGAIWRAYTGQIATVTSGDVLSMYTTSLLEDGLIPPQLPACCARPRSRCVGPI